MKPEAAAPRNPASLNGHHPPGSHISVSHATRYLSAAAHLRRSMLSAEIKDPDLQYVRQPLAVGRRYARRVLRGAEGVVPVAAVRLGDVQKECRIAFWQTVIRDACAIAVLVISAILQPWGTALTLGLLVGAVVLVGRVRLFSPAMMAVTIGVALALLEIGARRQISLAIPLICLAAFFVIYVADILLCAHHVRKIWRRSAQSPNEPEPPISEPLAGPSAVTPYQPSPQTSARGWGNGQTSLAGQASGYGAFPVGGRETVHYDKHGIVGAGTAWRRLTFTIPLDKALKDREIKKIEESELLRDIGIHIMSQGVADDERAHGYAYGPLSAEGAAQGLRPQSRHFTYGLPYLDVATVLAAPVPKAKNHPVRRVKTLRLNYNQPSVDEVLGMTNRSPSEHPERPYMRVRTSSWDGQLSISMYLNVALQAHFLRLVMRPYVLAPIVPDLKFADELAERHPLIVTCMAVAIAVRQFGWWIERLHDATSKTGASRKTTASPKPGLRSTREHYAQYRTENMHQTEDSSRIVEILEQKIFRVTMDYLREHNVDIGEYETQVLNYFYTVGTGNIITDSTFTDSPVTNVSGQGNTATGTSNPSK